MFHRSNGIVSNKFEQKKTLYPHVERVQFENLAPTYFSQKIKVFKSQLIVEQKMKHKNKVGKTTNYQG